jgi:serine/threonine-protein kinase
MSEPPASSDPGATGAYRPEQPAFPAAERFAPGALLAGRYRIVAVLGKGGMGEVYRADDLTLGQPVALKFLPPHLAADPDRLTRFRKEVAAARRVSHPNVCRVYDIADHGGLPILTMEFVDGEDLSALLQRVGRLPEEKGVEVARQLCSALAAVHDQGLLHRDLKPANVMLDGRGRVRLTDFGLAAVAADLSKTELRSGTPLYQAPEQLAGREVTVRSDLFALGLVLYELFTGKRAFAGTERDTPPSKPSAHVSGLNPAVERVVLQCLEVEPAKRPRSAVAVLAALPGGDPLAAALAAGETPSPQLVADAGGTGRIEPRTGLLLLAAAAAALLGVMALADQFAPYSRARLTASPAEMSHKARQTLAALGYPDAPADGAGGYANDVDWITYATRTDRAWARTHLIGYPGAIHFFYRESPIALVPHLPELRVIPDNPALTVPGMAEVRLDPRGRLVGLAVGPSAHTAGYRPTAGQDWSKALLAEAGLDATAFSPAAPEWTPPVACDARRAWVGRVPENPALELRIEAAAYNGRPVFFRLVGPWVGLESPFAGKLLPLGVSLAVMLLGLLLAMRNIRRGRADLRGGIWFWATCAAAYILYWLTGGHHVSDLRGEFNQAMQAIGRGLSGGLILRFVYVAIEPAVRRRWPRSLTALGRVMDGRWTDPMIGRDLLVGLAAGTGLTLVILAATAAGERPASRPTRGTGSPPVGTSCPDSLGFSASSPTGSPGPSASSVWSTSCSSWSAGRAWPGGCVP